MIVNIRNISILLKVHSFRKTEIKPILFFEPIVQEDFIRAELVVVRKLVTFELHRHTLAWSGEMSPLTRVQTVRDTCQQSLTHGRTLAV